MELTIRVVAGILFFVVLTYLIQRHRKKAS
jgi:hypothetical protein